MNPLTVLAIALVTVVAVKDRHGFGRSGTAGGGTEAGAEVFAERWRFAAVALGVMLPYSEEILRQLGLGIYLQQKHALLWSLPLQPLYALFGAALLSVALRMPWQRLFPAVLTGSLLTVLAGMLTEEGVVPLAVLAKDRIALAWLPPLDLMILGLALLGGVMVYMFRPFARDMARLTLLCMGVYIACAGVLDWQARKVGLAYAQSQNLVPASTGVAALRIGGRPRTDKEMAQLLELRVQPGAGLPLNRDILVATADGQVHLTKVRLFGRPAGENAAGGVGASAFYLPVEEAVWRQASRFGGMETLPVPVEMADDSARNDAQKHVAGSGVLSSADQRRVRQAWYAWRDSPFSWYKRWHVFQAFVDESASPLLAGRRNCVQFRDVNRVLAEAEGRQDVRAVAEAALPEDASEAVRAYHRQQVQLAAVRASAGDFVVCPGTDGGAARSRVYRFEPAVFGSLFGPPVYLRELVPLLTVRDLDSKGRDRGF